MTSENISLTQLSIDVRLSLQGALLGAVGANLRGVTCAYDRQVIQILAIFDGEFDDDNDKESIECVATEVIADFGNHTIDVECIRVDYPQPLSPYIKMDWVYLRKE